MLKGNTRLASGVIVTSPLVPESETVPSISILISLKKTPIAGSGSSLSGDIRIDPSAVSPEITPLRAASRPPELADKSIAIEPPLRSEERRVGKECRAKLRQD